MTKRRVKEGLAELADGADRDHEVQMARSELYQLAEYSIKLHDMLKSVSEEEGIEGWQQAKITKAADYISSVFHALEYDKKYNDNGSDQMDAMAFAQAAKESTDPYKSRLHRTLKEKAMSKSQQQAAGIALAAKRKGQTPKGKGAAADMAKMSTKELEKFAGTKHKGLPKKKTNETIDDTARRILGEGTEYELYLLLNEAPAGNVVNKIKTGLAKLPRNVAAKATNIIKKTPKAAWPLAAAALMTVIGPDAAQAGSDLANNMADSAMQGLIGKLQGIATDTANTAGDLANWAGGGADAAQGAAEVTRDQLKNANKILGGGSPTTLTDLIQNGVDLNKVKNVLTKFGMTDSTKIEMALQQIDGTNLRPFVDWVAQNR